MKRTKINILLITFLLFTMYAFGQVLAAELNGRKIFDRAQTLDTVNDFKAEMKMTIIRQSVRKRVRKLKTKTLNKENGVEMTMMRFLEPADVRGTGFLTVENTDGADKTYLYLPAMGKPRRISSEERGGNFMSSDFTYEDLSFTLSDYNHKLIGNEKIDGEDVYVVESIPVSKEIKDNVGFAKRKSYFSKERFVMVKSIYFNERGKKIKKLINSEFKQIKEGEWLVTRMVMQNEKEGSKTIIEYDDFEINTGISADQFSVRQLTRPL
ncbi:MAG: outer membrane lipoprotein-sorting protein [Halanaerobiales bacterium]|nr:outer membrane lipoprotein-sorting protein [Halanaerobiales bacterium]